MECRICFERFDKQLRVPTWVSCGHTYCSKCLEDMKESGRNYICPTCRNQITDEKTNYAVIDIIDLNPVFDINAGIRIDIKKSFKEIEETIREVGEKCRKKSLEITHKIDDIKMAINERARELVSMITIRKDLLVDEADKLKTKLNKKVSFIADTRYIKPIACETMLKPELDILRNKINETKKLLQMNQNKLDQIENLIMFRLDDAKELRIGEIGNPDQTEYFYNAEQCYKSNQFVKAIENLNKVIEINASFVEAYFLTGRCLERLNKNDLAIQVYEKAIEFNHVRSHNLKGFLLANKTEAKILFERALELNKTPISSQEFFNKGESYLGLNNYTEAIKCFEISIELNQNNPDSFRYKGVCFEKLEKYHEAIVAYEKEIELNPNQNFLAFKSKGNCLEKVGKYQEAVDFYNKVLNVYPNFVIGYKNKGAALEKMGKYIEAMNCFDKALEINPRFADAINAKGKSLDKLGRHLDAIECYDRAIEINPNYVDAYNNKGFYIYCLFFFNSQYFLIHTKQID